ncbi:EamA family transporter [Clostridium butyricum]|uniref:EamA family transporter n=1 Tax=Clostridium butyricum TaxID=1492 RepID=UPI0018AA20B0
MLVLILLFVYALLGALGMALIKKGGSNSSINKLNKMINVSLDYKFILGIIMYITSFVLWIIILQLFPIVYISPIAYGINFIFIAFFAFLFLKEKMRLMQIIGVIIIILGVLLVSL